MIATSPALQLTASGHDLNTRDTHFGFVRPSNDLLGDREALQARLAEDGYLYLKNFLDKDKVLAARRSILERLAADNLLHPSRNLMDAVVHPEQLEAFELETKPEFKSSRSLRKMKAGAFRPDIAVANREVEEVVFHPTIQNFYDNLFAETALHFDYIWLRVMGPGLGTPVHCDWVYMGRGSRQLLTCWIPYGEVPLHVGGLMVLEKSHLQADRIRKYLESDVDTYCENRPREVEKVKEKGGWSHPGWLSKYPHSLPDKFESRWLTAECWEPGDFFTFSMTLIHGSLDNHSNEVRISTDVRYQPSSHPADERWIGPNPPGHSTAGKRGRIC